MNTPMLAVLVAAVPTVVIALVGYGLRTLFEDVRSGVRDLGTGMKQLNEKVGGHGEKLAEHSARLTVLEREPQPRRRRGA